jgi:hypothetical protein
VRDMVHDEARQRTARRTRKPSRRRSERTSSSSRRPRDCPTWKHLSLRLKLRLERIPVTATRLFQYADDVQKLVQTVTENGEIIGVVSLNNVLKSGELAMKYTPSSATPAENVMNRDDLFTTKSIALFAQRTHESAQTGQSLFDQYQQDSAAKTADAPELRTWITWPR